MNGNGEFMGTTKQKFWESEKRGKSQQQPSSTDCPRKKQLLPPNMWHGVVLGFSGWLPIPYKKVTDESFDMTLMSVYQYIFYEYQVRSKSVIVDCPSGPTKYDQISRFFSPWTLNPFTGNALHTQKDKTMVELTSMIIYWECFHDFYNSCCTANVGHTSSSSENGLWRVVMSIIGLPPRCKSAKQQHPRNSMSHNTRNTIFQFSELPKPSWIR